MKRLTAFLIPLVLVAASLRAAEDWICGVSDHFELYTNANPATAGDALATFEEVHTFLASSLRLVPLSQDHTRLIVFSSDKEFAPYRPRPNVPAFYQAGADRDYIVLARLDKDSTAVAVHEYVHLFLRDYGGRFPVWLREGMAEAFSTLRIDQGRARYGEPSSSHLTSLRSGVTLLDVNRLFAVEPDSPEYKAQDHASVLYAQSWALVHMLLMDRRYDAKFWDFVAKVGDGASSADALMAVYGTTPDAVMSDLAGYIKQPQTSPRMAAPVRVRLAPTFQGRKADPFEIALVTASVRADAPGGEAEARATLQRLDKERPRALAVIEARAYLELRRSGRDAALPYFALAVAEGTRNAKLVHDYARLDPSKAAVLLPKALELAPDDVDLRLELATLLLTERKADQAIGVIAVTNGLSREQSFRRLHMLANAQVILSQFSEARASAIAARSFADSDQRRQDITALLGRIEESDATAKAAARDAPAISFSDDVVAAPAASAAAPAANQPESTLTMMGRIRNIVCLPKNGGLVLEVLVDKQTLRLLLAKPESVSVRGVESGTVDLNCGKQDQAVRVGFVPRNDAAQKTQGDLRMLDYSK